MADSCEGQAGREDADECGEDDVSWVRQARDTETLAGRGVKAWVRLTPGAQGLLGSPATGSSAPRAQRVLIGNRKLMAEEAITIPRQAPLSASPQAGLRQRFLWDILCI